MAERSFKAEVEQLKMGAGEVFTGEGILAITKALLENGVGYVGGYQGAPISHLMDVLADAEELLSDLGVRYEANASEAAAAAMLAASVHYPIRGAVTFKGSVPNLFEEGKGVVAEGFLKDRSYLKAVKILAKHDENYMPPEVSEALKDNK